MVSSDESRDTVGFITSPWYHPEKKKNIAMGYVPFEGTLILNIFNLKNFGKKYKVILPKKYSNKPVDAVVVPVPFTQSFNANKQSPS